MPRSALRSAFELSNFDGTDPVARYDDLGTALTDVFARLAESMTLGDDAGFDALTMPYLVRTSDEIALVNVVVGWPPDGAWPAAGRYRMTALQPPGGDEHFDRLEECLASAALQVRQSIADHHPIELEVKCGTSFACSVETFQGEAA